MKSQNGSLGKTILGLVALSLFCIYTFTLWTDNSEDIAPHQTYGRNLRQFSRTNQTLSNETIIQGLAWSFFGPFFKEMLIKVLIVKKAQKSLSL